MNRSVLFSILATITLFSVAGFVLIVESQGASIFSPTNLLEGGETRQEASSSRGNYQEETNTAVDEIQSSLKDKKNIESLMYPVQRAIDQVSKEIALVVVRVARLVVKAFRVVFEDALETSVGIDFNNVEEKIQNTWQVDLWPKE